MDLLIYMLFGIVGLFILFQLWILWQSKKQIGQEAPVTRYSQTGQHEGTTLFFFHSPHCGPCKAMTPAIEEIGKQHQVVNIDIGEDLETAQAFNVRATPTVILVKDGLITNVMVGALSQQKIESLFS